MNRVLLLAVMAAGSLLAQTPTPAQGRYYAGSAYKVVAVDADGKLIISNPGGSASCTLMAPCYVIGVDADGVMSTTNPVQVAGKDPVSGVTRELRINTQGLFMIGPTANGAVVDATANPVLVGVASATGRARTLFSPSAVLDAAAGDNIAAIQPYYFNGSTYDRQIVCNKQLPIQLTAASDAVIIPAGGGTTRAKICHIDWSIDSGQVATLREGTGVTCGTSTNNLTGGYIAPITFAQDYSNVGLLRNQSNNVDTCVHFAGPVTGGGVVIYAQ